MFASGWVSHGTESGAMFTSVPRDTSRAKAHPAELALRRARTQKFCHGQTTVTGTEVGAMFASKWLCLSL